MARMAWLKVMKKAAADAAAAEADADVEVQGKQREEIDLDRLAADLLARAPDPVRRLFAA